MHVCVWCMSTLHTHARIHTQTHTHAQGAGKDICQVLPVMVPAAIFGQPRLEGLCVISRHAQLPVHVT